MQWGFCSTGDRFQQGLEALRAGDFERAAALFVEVVGEQPSNRDAYLLAARCYAELEDWVDAREVLERAEARFPDDTEVLKALAGVLANQGQYAAAAHRLEKLLELDPFQPKVRESLGALWYNAGIQAQEKGDLRSAVSAYRRAAELLPQDVRPYRSLAAVWLKLDQPDSALQVVAAALRDHPGDEKLINLQAAAFHKKGDLKGLASALEKLVREHPDSVGLALDLALVYRVAHRLDRALAIYDSLQARFPRNRRVFEAVAQHYWDHLNYEGVRQTWQRYLKPVPQDTSAWLEVARAWEAEGKWDQAVKVYQRLLRDRPRDLNLLGKLAQAQRRAGDWAAAGETLRTLVALRPEKARLWFALGEANARVGRFDDALQAFRTAAAKDSSWAEPWIEMGKIYEKRWQKDRARVCFQKAIEVGTSNPVPYHRLAAAALAEGDTARFVRFEERALSKAVRTVAKLESNFRAGLRELSGLQASKLASMSESAARLREAEAVLRDAAKRLRQVQGIRFDNYIEKLLRRYPGAKALWLLRAQTAESRGDWSEAVRTYEKLLSLDPSQVEAQKGLGRALEKLGKDGLAQRAYERALALDPNDESVYQALIRVAQRTGTLEKLVRRWERLASFHPDWALLGKYLAQAKRALHEAP